MLYFVQKRRNKDYVPDDEKGKVRSMCEVLDRAITKGIQQGIQQGKAEAEQVILLLKEQIKKLEMQLAMRP